MLNPARAEVSGTPKGSKTRKNGQKPEIRVNTRILADFD